ncbi:hypothetical protein NUH16_011090 [Penicillium rubens]|nr:hypothetical protein NUH16_011090 [Penicillium rubens]
MALFWSIQVQIPVRLMKRHPHRIFHNQQLVDCPLGLQPVVHRRVYSIGLSRRTHQAQILTKQQAGNGDSVKLHPPHLSNKQVVNGTWGTTKSRGVLDDCCPNVMRRRRSKDDLHHPITSEDLVRLLKAQLDENIDRCTPLGGCGAYGAPVNDVVHEIWNVMSNRVGRGDEVGFCTVSQDDRKVYNGRTETSKGQPSDVSGDILCPQEQI